MCVGFQAHVRHSPPVTRIFREGLECHRGDKLDRVVRHDDVDRVSAFHEFAGQIGGFVGGDGASHAKDD